MNWFALVWLAGLGIGVYLIPHYLAPFTAGVYLLGLQAMRHLRVWRPEGKPVGHAMCGVLMFIMFATAGLRLFAEPLHMVPPPWPIGPWLCTWSGAGQYGAPRANVAGKFEAMPGKHLLIVRYSEEHEAGDEWVYNLADVEGAKTVWAREMDDASNAELFAHYTDRDVWLVEPDVNGGRVTPYKAGSLTATR